ncbi:MAG: hypothetical protein KGM47_11690, partial [Acidobacteriota bacterium]|nr:hypothetical protein [Acidobacteriota bacterium]
MNKKSLETAATIALGAVCAGLIFHLVVRVRSVHAGAPPVLIRSVRSAPRTPSLFSKPGLKGAEAYPDGPVLHLDLYDQIQSRTLRAPDHNPFSFEPTPQ